MPAAAPSTVVVAAVGLAAAGTGCKRAVAVAAETAVAVAVAVAVAAEIGAGTADSRQGEQLQGTMEILAAVAAGLGVLAGSQTVA